MWKSLLFAVALGLLMITPTVGQNSTHEAHTQAGSQFGQMMSAAMDKMHEQMAGFFNLSQSVDRPER
jgi:hypothetical protein